MFAEQLSRLDRIGLGLRSSVTDDQDPRRSVLDQGSPSDPESVVDHLDAGLWDSLGRPRGDNLSSKVARFLFRLSLIGPSFLDFYSVALFAGEGCVHR